MRFWSLKTFRSVFFHGMSCHLSIGCSATVFIAYQLLLVPLPSKRSCSRQPILKLSLRHLLLEQSLSDWYPVDTCSLSGNGCFSENQPELLRSSTSFVVTLRIPLFAGFRGSVSESVPQTLSPHPCLLAAADNPRRLPHPNDDSVVVSSAYP